MVRTIRLFLCALAVMVHLIGCSPSLMEVLRQGDLAAVKAKLDKSAERTKKNTALIYAASQGKLDIVQYALDIGASVDAHDSDDHTALMRAAEAGHAAIVRVLLDKGADIHAQRTAVRWKGDQTTADSRGCIASAAYTTPDGANALILAIEGGHIDIVQLLLEKGARANVKLVWKDMSQPMFNPAYYRGLLSIGVVMDTHCVHVSQKFLLNVTKEKESTPLIIASFMRHTKIVQLLLSYGANMHLTDSEGLTALMHAETRGYTDIVRLLQPE